MDSGTILLRFAVAFVLSFAFGLARQKLGKPIGFGTFIFVALGSCGLSLTAVSFHTDNPLPLLGAIMTGIGFLGAGALFKTADRIVGFTSAATIWIFAVFGLAIGVGEYLVGALVYATTWCVILIDRAFEHRWFGAYQRKLTVAVALDADYTTLERELGLPPRATAQSLRADREEGTLTLVYTTERRERADELVDRLRASELVRSFSLD